MGTRAIFANSGVRFWIDTAAYLRDKYNWVVPYFIGADAAKKIARETFPHAVFHTNSEAKKNMAPQECSGIYRPPLDQDLITALLPHEHIILKMLNRNDGDGSFTYSKRVFYYHSQVMYWMGIIDHFKPDVVVFRTAPHMGFDYALYAVCDILGVRTIMFEKTAIVGVIIPMSSFRRGSAVLKKEYEKRIDEYHSDGSKKIELSENMKRHIDDLSQRYEKAMPFLLKHKLQHHKNRGELEANIMTFFYIGRDILRGLWIRDRDYLKKRFYRNTATFTKKKLASHYHRLAKKVDLDRPFIFVALQCEPERQAVPCGGVFGDQYLMIDLLSKSVPEGWKIYVKEHVSQFKSYQHAERGRSIEFYDYVHSLPNVELVPLSYTSFDLIDKAVASATVSGSVGWESVVRGKPALLFGYAWYRDCEGVFVTHSKTELELALKKISKGYKVDRDRILLFSSALEDVSFKGSIDPAFDSAGILSYEQNVINFAESINDSYNHYNG